MASFDLEKFLEGAKGYLPPEFGAIVEELKDDFDIGKLGGLVTLGAAVVERASLDIEDIVTGSDKKKALVKWLDECVDLPFYLEPFDDNIISMLIEGIITGLNTLFGQGWVEKLQLIKADVE